MSKRASPGVIGAFVVGALALAIVSIGLFGSGLWRANHKLFVLFFESDVSGLRTGAPVKFHGVEIGSVKEVLLNLTGATRGNLEGVHIPVIIAIDDAKLKARGAEIQLDDPEMFKRMVASGLRGQLSIESIVTGVLYVRLDLFPGSQERYAFDTGVDTYPQIPTVPTEFEQIQMRATEFISRLDKVDLESLVRALTNAANSIDSLASSGELKNSIEALGGTLRSLQATSESVRALSGTLNVNVTPLRGTLERTASEADAALRTSKAALEDLQRGIGAEAPMWQDLRTALQDISDAAQSVRALADSLEHNPGLLLRGKAVPEEKRP